MIIIDRDLSAQKIVLTLDGFTQVSPLFLTNDANRKNYSINLGSDLSTFPERFNEFLIDTDDFSTLDEGYYTYSVNKLNSDFVIETGKLLIKHTSTGLPELSEISTDIVIL